MEKSRDNKGSREAGNVIFIILLAIALFAALSYAISRGDRGGGNLDKTRARVVANDIISYGASIASAIEQIRQEGASENEISFAHPLLSTTYGTYDSTPATEVFNPRGGGVSFQIPGGSMASGDPLFTATNDVRNVGTRCANASCTNCNSINSPNCVDLVMIQALIDVNVCTGINDILNVGDDVQNLALLNGSFDDTLFAGSYAYQDPIESSGPDNIFNAQTAGCFEGSTGAQDGIYYFYYVLLAR